MLQDKLKTIWKTAAEQFCLNSLFAQTLSFLTTISPLDAEFPY